MRRQCLRSPQNRAASVTKKASNLVVRALFKKPRFGQSPQSGDDLLEDNVEQSNKWKSETGKVGGGRLIGKNVSGVAND